MFVYVCVCMCVFCRVKEEKVWLGRERAGFYCLCAQCASMGECVCECVCVCVRMCVRVYLQGLLMHSVSVGSLSTMRLMISCTDLFSIPQPQVNCSSSSVSFLLLVAKCVCAFVYVCVCVCICALLARLARNVFVCVCVCVCVPRGVKVVSVVYLFDMWRVYRMRVQLYKPEGGVSAAPVCVMCVCVFRR